MPERSVAIKTTSDAIPVSSHDFAVISAALPPAHMAETDMVGPWKSNSFMKFVSTVAAIMFTQVLGRTLVEPDR